MISLDYNFKTSASTIFGNPFNSYAEKQEQDENTIINRALNFALYAYSVWWLRLGDMKQNQDSDTRKDFISWKLKLSVDLWRQARQHIDAVLSRPTYRSILALYLFAIIPSSHNREGDCIEDLCIEASLNHQKYLRSRVLMKIHDPDPMLDLLETTTFPSTRDVSSSNQMEDKCMMDIAYWFGVISDTTRSLMRCQPSIMLPGRSGEGKVWAAVRQRTKTFESEFKNLATLRAPLSDGMVITILQHAFAFKTLVWAAITRVQDALFHQVSDITLSEAIDTVRTDSNRFEEVFSPLLSICERDFILLSRTTQMSYSKKIRSARRYNADYSSSVAEYSFPGRKSYSGRHRPIIGSIYRQGSQSV